MEGWYSILQARTKEESHQETKIVTKLFNTQIQISETKMTPGTPDLYCAEESW